MNKRNMSKEIYKFERSTVYYNHVHYIKIQEIKQLISLDSFRKISVQNQFLGRSEYFHSINSISQL